MDINTFMSLLTGGGGPQTPTMQKMSPKLGAKSKSLRKQVNSKVRGFEKKNPAEQVDMGGAPMAGADQDPQALIDMLLGEVPGASVTPAMKATQGKAATKTKPAVEAKPYADNWSPMNALMKLLHTENDTDNLVAMPQADMSSSAAGVDQDQMLAALAEILGGKPGMTPEEALIQLQKQGINGPADLKAMLSDGNDAEPDDDEDDQ